MDYTLVAFLSRVGKKCVKIFFLFALFVIVQYTLHEISGVAIHDDAKERIFRNSYIIILSSILIYIVYLCAMGGKPSYQAAFLWDVLFYGTQFGLFYIISIKYYDLNTVEISEQIKSYLFANLLIYFSTSALICAALRVIKRLYSDTYKKKQPRRLRRMSSMDKIITFGAVFAGLWILILFNLFIYELDVSFNAYFYLPAFPFLIIIYEKLASMLFK